MNALKLSLPSMFVYGALIFAALFGLYALGESSPDQSATMAPDLRVLR